MTSTFEIISIVPVELFTEQNAEKAKEWFSKKRPSYEEQVSYEEKARRNKEDGRKRSYDKLSDLIHSYAGSSEEDSTELLDLHPTSTEDSESLLLRVGTSIVFIYVTKLDITELSKLKFHDLHFDYLGKMRLEQNKWLQPGYEKSEEKKYFADYDEAMKNLIDSKEELLGQEYVLDSHINLSHCFTFYYVKFGETQTPANTDFLKQVMDYSESNGFLPHSDSPDVPDENSITVYSNSSVYFNLSTICVAEPYQVANSTFRNKIMALEIALHVSLNRCHAMSELIDKILKDKNIRKAVNTEELYNSFLYATDEVGSLGSPMTSKGIVDVYHKMIEISRIGIERSRLETRLKMLSRHDEREEAELLGNHQRSTEYIFLFLSLFTILSAVFGFRWADLGNDWRLIVGISVVGVVFISLLSFVLLTQRKHSKNSDKKISFLR